MNKTELYAKYNDTLEILIEKQTTILAVNGTTLEYYQALESLSKAILNIEQVKELIINRK